MIRSFLLTAALPLLLGLDASAEPPPVTPGEVIVVVAPFRNALGTRSSASDALGLAERARGQGVAVRGADPLCRPAVSRRAFGGDAWVVRLEAGADPAAAAARLARDPGVVYAGPNHLGRFTQTLPDDPIADDQYALFSSRVFEAWEVADGTGVLIAIVDSGVELGHPDLVNQIAINEAEANGLPGVDDDDNGFVDDIRGYDFTDVPGWPGSGDFLERDADPSDDLGHGTQVAGVAAAERNNGKGIAGVAPGARILPVRAGFRSRLPFVGGFLQEDDAAAGILYAADRGARIINLSFGDVTDFPIIRHAVRYAQSRGALVVASAGNTGRDEVFYPAAYPGVLSAGASNSLEVRALFSTFGQDLDLLAPGLGIITTSLPGRYSLASGTSFSAPMVAGAAALVWSHRPEWSAEQVAWRLRLASHRGSEGWTPGDGWGILDAAAAVTSSVDPPVAGISAQRPLPGRGLRLDGTVADPGLFSWSLFAVPNDQAVGREDAGAIPGERLLVREATRQAVEDSLAAFQPGPGDTGLWVFRLAARLRDGRILEERSRARLAAPELGLRDLRFELQAGQEGWDLVAAWTSSERHQGALDLTGPGVVPHAAQESFLGTSHGLRLPGPLPAGSWAVRVSARAEVHQPFIALVETMLTVPPVPATVRSSARQAFGPGTPMPETLDRDGDGFPEILVEEPPVNDPYGYIRGWELIGDTAEEWGTSENVFRGIPLDIADADGDGKLELIAFRNDFWRIFEAARAGEFPEREIHEDSIDRSLPCRFVTTPSGIRLLDVAGTHARLFRSEDGSGYVLESEASSGGAGLAARAVQADFDEDGTDEVVLVDQDGRLAFFELAASGIRLDRTITLPLPVTPAIGLVRGPGPRVDLVTAERDPATPVRDGDLDRAATRLRRWRWSGDRYLETGSLSLAGMMASADLQFLEEADGLLFRRRGRLDRIGATGDGGLAWLGRAHESPLSEAEGAVIARPQGEAPVIWIGSSEPVSLGEILTLEPAEGARAGGPLAVLEVNPSPDLLEITLGWEPDGCSGVPALERSGDLRGDYVLPVDVRRAQDLVAPEERVIYRLTRGSCRETLLEIEGQAGVPPLLRSEGSDLLLESGTPLREPRAVRLAFVKDGAERGPEAVHALEGGRGFRIAFAGNPDSLIVRNATLVSGLPLGGTARLALPVPPRPAPSRPLALAEVRYRAADPGLLVTLSGDAAACDLRFRVEPGGLALTSAEREGTFAVDLPGSLARGTYTVTLEGECLDPEALGLSRTLRVGRAIYPNPLGPGQDLVVENAEPGTRISLHDLRGEERLAFTMAAPVERRSLQALAPGLYLVRFVLPDGTLEGVERLGVIR